MRFRILAAALAALAVHATPAHAQPDPPPLVTADPPPVLKRVADLERENVLLKARVAALEDAKPSPAKGESADRWTHPQFPGVVFTKAQLTAMYPGIAFNTSAAPGVARTTAPFDSCPDKCDLAGCSSTPTTPVTAAGTPGATLTYGLGRSGAVVISTGAGCAATSGGTSGCTAAGCSVQTSRTGWYPGKLLGR